MPVDHESLYFCFLFLLLFFYLDAHPCYVFFVFFENVKNLHIGKKSAPFFFEVTECIAICIIFRNIFGNFYAFFGALFEKRGSFLPNCTVLRSTKIQKKNHQG